MTTSYITPGKREPIAVFYGPNNRLGQQRRGELFQKMLFNSINIEKLADKVTTAEIKNFLENVGYYHKKLNAGDYATELRQLKQLKENKPAMGLNFGKIIKDVIDNDGKVLTAKFAKILEGTIDKADTGKNYNGVYKTGATGTAFGDNADFSAWNENRAYLKSSFKKAGISVEPTLKDIAVATVAADPFSQPIFDDEIKGSTGAAELAGAIWTKQNGQYGILEPNNPADITKGYKPFQPYDYKKQEELSDIDENDCFGTGLKVKDKDTCKKDIEKCLIDGNVKECIDHLTTSGNITSVKRDIVKLHPVNALQFLEMFGFEKSKSTNKVMNVDTWFANFATKKLEEADITKLKGSKLLEFLKVLVSYVNFHNGILGEGDSSAADAGSADAKLGGIVPFYKIPPAPENYAYNAKVFSTNFRNNPGNFSNFFSSFLAGMSGMGGMYGGGETEFREGSIMPFNNATIGSITQEGGQRFVIRAPAQGFGNRCGAKLVENVINGQIASLRAAGKSLDSISTKKINDWIANLKKSEEHLLKYIQVLQKANQMYRSKGNTGREQISLSTLENYVNKFRHVHKKHRNIYQILTDIYLQLATLQEEKEGKKLHSDPNYEPIII